MPPTCSETNKPPALAGDEAHIWSVPLDDPRITWTKLMAVLAADERERAERFRLDDARRRFVTARAALRRLLGEYLQMSPAEVAFDYDANGKPRLKHSAEAFNLQFNLAHSGELALVAVARGCEVGVDVERLREVNHWREIAERYFHPRELDEIVASPPAEQLAAFMRCWTGKEAVLKALGTGVTRPLDFFVGDSQPDAGTWLDVPAAAGSTARCWLLPLAPAADYIGAMASVGAQRRPRCFALL
ncbi:MAG: 4'-phosphopantetheinyl transferase superfamily protein [Pirellulales bacterium]